MNHRDWLAALPPKRKALAERVQRAFSSKLDSAFVEGMQYGGWAVFVPHSLCPAGYHCDSTQPVPFASMRNSKAKLTLHLFGLYVDPDAAEAFAEAWRATGYKLDMGKGCVRLKSVDDVPWAVLEGWLGGVQLKTFMAQYEASLPEKVRKKRGVGAQ